MHTLAISNNSDYRFFYRSLFLEILNEIASFANLQKRLLVDLLLTTSDEVWELNRQWRKQDKTTDVLSFPSQLSMFTELDFMHLGQIVFNVERVREQANKYGHSLKREFAYLFTHSLLHLLGYDHENAQSEALMHHIIEKILKKLKILRKGQNR